MTRFRWSANRLLLYLKCPYAYFLRYEEKIKVPVPWYLVFGDTVHESIKVCHKGNPHQHFEPTPERPLFFRSSWTLAGFWIKLFERKIAKAEEETGIQWDYEGQKEDLVKLGWIMLAGKKDGSRKGYYRCILNPPFQINLLEVEYQIWTKLWEKFPAQARIDQIWETSQGTALVDLTTGRSHDVKFLQITLYDLCLKQHCRDDPEARKRFGSEASIHYIWSLRDEKLIPIEPQEPQTLREGLEYAAANIQDGEFHETQQDHVCRYCEYREICGKLTGKPIPAADGAESEISLPARAKKPRPQQLYFKRGAAGGWFRGTQVKGHKRPRD